MTGTPVFNCAEYGLAGNTINKISGILNGTCNFILSQMETGMSYEAALAEAQRLGYAEANPAADVEGRDALAKVVILANTLMGADLSPGDVPCTGISALTSADIETAEQENSRWRLIGTVERTEDGVRASVQPVKLPASDPLAGIQGPTNALTFSTDLLGDVTVSGAGAGRMETGYAVVADLLAIARTASDG